MSYELVTKNFQIKVLKSLQNQNIICTFVVSERNTDKLEIMLTRRALSTLQQIKDYVFKRID